MQKEDMILLIRAEDAINEMDKIFSELTGTGLSNGKLRELDNVYQVIMRNSHRYYAESMSNIAEENFYGIISNRELSAEERAGLLLGRTDK